MQGARNRWLVLCVLADKCIYVHIAIYVCKC